MRRHSITNPRWRALCAKAAQAIVAASEDITFSAAQAAAAFDKTAIAFNALAAMVYLYHERGGDDSILPVGEAAEEIRDAFDHAAKAFLAGGSGIDPVAEMAIERAEKLEEIFDHIARSIEARNPADGAGSSSGADFDIVYGAHSYAQSEAGVAFHVWQHVVLSPTAHSSSVWLLSRRTAEPYDVSEFYSLNPMRTRTLSFSFHLTDEESASARDALGGTRKNISLSPMQGDSDYALSAEMITHPGQLTIKIEGLSDMKDQEAMEIAVNLAEQLGVHSQAEQQDASPVASAHASVQAARPRPAREYSGELDGVDIGDGRGDSYYIAYTVPYDIEPAEKETHWEPGSAAYVEFTDEPIVTEVSYAPAAGAEHLPADAGAKAAAQTWLSLKFANDDKFTNELSDDILAGFDRDEPDYSHEEERERREDSKRFHSED